MIGTVAEALISQPLNLAHFHGRKAEELQESGDVMGAIYHHESASKFFQAALDNSEIVGEEARLSLTLQKSSHVHKIRVLKALHVSKVEIVQREFSHGDKKSSSVDENSQECKENRTEFSILQRKIQTGTTKELRAIGMQLLDIVKMQQEQIIYLSTQLQVINSENKALKKNS